MSIQEGIALRIGPLTTKPSLVKSTSNWSSIAVLALKKCNG
jgi:hypothetical protein